MNPVLKEEVEGIRSLLYTNATKDKQLPAHYTIEPIEGRPASRITDTRSGLSIDVGLCNLPGAIQALEAFG